ncbi:16S/23S rRNA (cytidine-2'-O)-methyltransferase TlyA [Slackia heliotrinireducens]|uniref:Hemolysin A n=1 Tax=Slackia heliotrinireducens (strain ATCC 29202 / DSM 20476 / NCTC 11029 / RHS 1) TaxID=471855 RepID=C7N702_SLAHD|nr:TlyA family RNA methyltransferase [Slackia heliotrinireducens]ACV22687.1 hemolysin A [Slackia heliotrinireducens DSM 20476]VEH01280.1 16S/23S rRNA (cytidine-2'-O)-methyltransferase TlyA [Slackia heliotrinireducens]
MRLDVALVERGLEPSRAKAKASIAAGLVFVNGRNVTKASLGVDDGDAIEVQGTACAYVGRGGLKLEHALRAFGLDIQGMTCVDVGSSTGGFTDCMLSFGAARVFSIDVGHDQLAPKLLADPRVVSLEGIDARSVTSETLGGPADFAATDVSFISLDKVLTPMAGMIREGASAVCLIKPQFEAGRTALNKKGVVKDVRVHQSVIEQVLSEAQCAGFTVCGLDFSPISGGDGNIEYLMHIRKGSPSPDESVPIFDIPALVQAAHAVHAG